MEMEKNMDIIDLKESISMERGGMEREKNLTFQVNIMKDDGGMELEYDKIEVTGYYYYSCGKKIK